MRNEIDTAAARELYLWANNSRDIYCRYLEPIQNNFIRKARKGTFNAALAPKAYTTALREAAKLYSRYFGGNWAQMFNTATRAAVAAEFVRQFEEKKSI